MSVFRNSACAAGALWLGLTSGAAPGLAQGIPVIDTSAIAQMVVEFEEMTQQGVVLGEQLGQLQQQVQQLDQQINAITGGRDLAGILDGSDYDALNTLLPPDIMEVIEGGASPEVTAIYEDMLAEYGLRSPEELSPHNPEAPTTRAIYDASQRVYATLAVAEASLESGEEVIANYQRLIAAVDDTDDIKASMDLAARIAAENGLAIARLQQLIAADMQMRGALERSRIVVRDRPRQPSEEDDDFLSDFTMENAEPFTDLLAIE